MELGEDAKTFALIQPCYQYMNNVALTETEVVIPITLRIANGRIANSLPDHIRRLALTVVVDEAYHALVARDFMEGVQNSTGVAPLSLPGHTELELAIYSGS